jgi:hypothetical protein
VAKKDDLKKEFLQGMLWACAFVAYDHDTPTFAVDAIVHSGFRWKDFVDAGCDSYDLDRLKEAFDVCDLERVGYPFGPGEREKIQE